MKKLAFFTLVGLVFATTSAAQNYNSVPRNNNAVKAKLYGGYVLPIGTAFRNMHTDRPAMGAEIDWELNPIGQYPWQQWWGFPAIGVGFAAIDLGSAELGQMAALYPYALWKLALTEKFEFGIKTGFGIAGFTKKSIVNGSHIAGYLSTALDFQIRLSYDYNLSIEVGTNHTNNCDLSRVNYTTNIVYATIGMHHTFTRIYRRPSHRYFKDLPYDFMVNVAALGAAKDPGYATYSVLPVINLHADILFRATNCYALGVGIDGFYNGNMVAQGISPNGTNFGEESGITNPAYYITPNEGRLFKNKVKVGLAFSNLFTMGRVGIIADAGLYLWDNTKNFYRKRHEDFQPDGKPVVSPNAIIYRNNFARFDGYLYFRGGLRCRIYDNLFAQLSIKTHVYHMDCLEAGIGYSIPVKRDYHMDRKANKFKHYRVWHPDSKANRR